jgi:hypothetical protein
MGSGVVPCGEVGDGIGVVNPTFSLDPRPCEHPILRRERVSQISWTIRAYAGTRPVLGNTSRR